MVYKSKKIYFILYKPQFVERIQQQVPVYTSYSSYVIKTQKKLEDNLIEINIIMNPSTSPHNFLCGVKRNIRGS